MSGGAHGGGGNADRWNASGTRIVRSDGVNPDKIVEINSRSESGGYGGSHGSHGGGGWASFGKGAALALAVAAGAIGGAAVFGGGRERPVIAGSVDAGDPSVNRAPAGDTDEEASGATTETVEERLVTVEGDLGQLEVELPATHAEGERLTLTLIFDDAEGFAACEGDEKCRRTLAGVPNAEHSGALTGWVEVISPLGEPNKRAISRELPLRVTIEGGRTADGGVEEDRTITIDPDHTRVRIGDGDVMPLRPVLGEPQSSNP